MMQDMEQVYRQHMLYVYKYLFSLCQNAQIAEELTQETFFRAVKSIDSFRGTCKLTVWLCQIAKNLWYKESQKRKTQAPLTNDIPASANLEQDTILQDEKMMLFKRIHALNEPYREVMYLRLSGECSFCEIGEILGRDENWARVTFYRGKQRLREENHT